MITTTDLLQVQPKVLQTRHGRDVLPLVPLDSLDGHDAVGEQVGLLGLCRLGFGRLLLGVLSGALLGCDRE